MKNRVLKGLLIVGLVTAFLTVLTPFVLDSTRSEIDTFIVHDVQEYGSEVETSCNLFGGHRYRINIEMEEATVGEANVSGLVVVMIAGELVLEEQLTDYMASSSGQYGFVIAKASVSYEETVADDTLLNITGIMESGRSWSVTVHEDVPDELYTRLFILEILTAVSMLSFILTVIVFSWFPCVACIRHVGKEEEPDSREDELSIDPV